MTTILMVLSLLLSTASLMVSGILTLCVRMRPSDANIPAAMSHWSCACAMAYFSLIVTVGVAKLLLAGLCGFFIVNGVLMLCLD